MTLKYRREDFQTFSRSQSVKTPIDSTAQTMQTALELLAEMRKSQPRPVRLLGVSLGNLTDVGQATQGLLFDVVENQTANKRVDQVVDQLADSLGKTAVYRGTSHDWIQRNKKS